MDGPSRDPVPQEAEAAGNSSESPRWLVVGLSARVSRSAREAPHPPAITPVRSPVSMPLEATLFFSQTRSGALTHPADPTLSASPEPGGLFLASSISITLETVNVPAVTQPTHLAVRSWPHGRDRPSPSLSQRSPSQALDALDARKWP